MGLRRKRQGTTVTAYAVKAAGDDRPTDGFRAEARSESWVWPAVIPTGTFAQPVLELLWLGPAAGALSSCPGRNDPAVRPAT